VFSHLFDIFSCICTTFLCFPLILTSFISHSSSFAARRIPPSSVIDNAPKRVPTQRRTGGGDPSVAGGLGRGVGNSDMLNTDEAMDAFEASVYADDHGRPQGNKRFSAQVAGSIGGGQGAVGGAQHAHHPSDGVHAGEGHFGSAGAAARPMQGGNAGRAVTGASTGAVRSAGNVAGGAGNRVGGAAAWTAAGSSGAEAEQEETLYCLCNRPSFGEMIACDNNACKIEWFHLPCVGLSASNRPRGKWYCPECSKDSSLSLADETETEVINENGKRRRS
jgi:PHD-finger